MEPRIHAPALLALAIVGCTATINRAAWQPTGTPVCIELGSQTNVEIIGDGFGGVIVAWIDDRSGEGYDIYAQRFDASGNALWSDNGVAVCTLAGLQQDIQLLADSDGGVYISWLDYPYPNDFNLLIQYLDESGTPLWSPNGISVCSLPRNQEQQSLVRDQDDGVIIVWSDQRLGFVYADIYAQRFDENGNPLWQSNGVQVSNAPGNERYPDMIPDGDGGGIVVWQADDGESDIVAQRIDAMGVALWASGGVVVSTAPAQRHPKLATDQNGGAFITWSDTGTNSPHWDIRAQRISSAGIILWPIDTDVSIAPYEQRHQRIVSDGAGGAIVSWDDSRANGYSWDIYAQRVDANGSVAWTVDGVEVCNAPNHQHSTVIASDARGGAVIAWLDNRERRSLVYAQRLSDAGQPLWSANGIPVSQVGHHGVPAITGLQSGVVLAWPDDRNGNSDIYAQFVAMDGTIPTIVGDEPAVGSAILHPAFPNPCVDVTTLSLQLVERSSVQLDLYDVSGGHLSRYDYGILKAGFHALPLQFESRLFPSGVYFAKVTASGLVSTQKIVVRR